eukprot:TRINITY_DN2727_c0_g1_i4.p2 TRINITY_DN2727_c0_g1~~TRINITY_DN2727_c0_g1_i4.p2  ORF type:complete len:118 (+),score=16.59 TRINITY_DN2727_c0_g1_i4:467-820(+)
MKKREMKMSMWVQHIKDKIGSMAKEKRILKCSKEEMIVGKMLQIFPWIYFQASLSSMIQKGMVEHAPFLLLSLLFFQFRKTDVIFQILLIYLSLIHISEPTRRTPISYAVFCLKKKK